LKKEDTSKNNHHSLFKDTYQASISILLTIGSLIFLSTISARFLDVAKYGELALIMYITDLFSIICGFGIQNNLTVFIAQFKSEGKTKRTFLLIKWIFRYFSISILFGSLIIFLYFLLSRTFLDVFELSFILVYFINKNLSNFYISCLTGFFNFKIITKYNLLYNFLLVILVPTGIYFFGLKGAFFSYFLTSFTYLFFVKSRYLFLNKNLLGNIELLHKKSFINNSLLLWSIGPTTTHNKI